MEGEAKIYSVDEYIKLIRDFEETARQGGCTEGVVFRGQRADHPLIPKIARLKPKADLLATEKQLLQEFKRTNPLLLEGHRPYDDWDYLAIGQHFGLPTRLLDWSNNALTALWFATSGDEIIGERSGQPVVWVMQVDQADLDLDIEASGPFSLTRAKIFRPRLIKQRINNQSGVFSVQPSEEVQNCVELKESDGFSDKLLKISIDVSGVPGILQDLNTLGVNAFTIFPELEGLCSYLRWRYFY
jgi:hypothetical protein